MSYEFTVDEIREAVSAAQIYSRGYTEEQFQASTELVKRLRESGYLEGVQSLARLEKERGVRFTEVLDTCEQLLEENEKLEQKAVDNRAKLEMVGGEVRQAQDKLHQLEDAIKQAKAEREREEKELIAFKKKAEREQGRINEELEQCRQEANVTKEETATAGQLKAEVGKHGFNLGLKRELTLTKCNEEAAEQNEALQSDRKSLTEECQQLASHLSQLRADTAFEERVRHFYRRYQSAGTLMEWLASWSDIYFGCCGNPIYDATKVVNRSIRGAYFWTEKRLGGTCPCCGYPRTLYDEGIYQALNLPIGEPYKLQLGE